jgi:hypothetical protein
MSKRNYRKCKKITFRNWDSQNIEIQRGSFTSEQQNCFLGATHTLWSWRKRFIKTNLSHQESNEPQSAWRACRRTSGWLMLTTHIVLDRVLGLHFPESTAVPKKFYNRLCIKGCAKEGQRGLEDVHFRRKCQHASYTSFNTLSCNTQLICRGFPRCITTSMRIISGRNGLLLMQKHLR